MRQFYGHLEKCILSAGKNHVRKIPLFFWGGGLGGGGECRFHFYGRADFSEKKSPVKNLFSVFWLRAQPWFASLQLDLCADKPGLASLTLSPRNFQRHNPEVIDSMY